MPSNDKPLNETVEMKNDDNDHDDTMTIYSMESSHTPDSLKEAYIVELAEDLINKIRAQTRDHNDLPMQRMYARLPEALQAFAKIFGHIGKSQEARDVMVFVSRYRE